MSRARVTDHDLNRYIARRAGWYRTPDMGGVRHQWNDATGHYVCGGDRPEDLERALIAHGLLPERHR